MGIWGDDTNEKLAQPKIHPNTNDLKLKSGWKKSKVLRKRCFSLFNDVIKCHNVVRTGLAEDFKQCMGNNDVGVN